MQRILEIAGQRETPQPPEQGARQDLIGAKAQDAVRIAASRDAETATLRLAVADDDIVEVEFGDGLELWMRVDEIADELNIQPVRGSQAPLPRRSRSALAWSFSQVSFGRRHPP